MIKSEIKLYDHQKRALEKIEKHDGNLILSHGTGSGKTLTSIAAFEQLKGEGKATKALVVTPASLRVNFLENGIGKFTDSKGAIFGNSQEVSQGIARPAEDPDKNADYHIVSYDMYRKDPKKYIEAAGADTVIYDELHKIRNESGVTYQTLKDARKHHKNFIGLTGSIMNNTPGDLVPLVDAMTDGKHRLGTKATFERRFVREDKDGKHLTNPIAVRALLNPFIDHFETKDLSDQTMPKKVVQEVKVMMSPYQTELYQYAIDKMDPVVALKFRFGASKLKEREINNIFAKLIQARQVSNSMATLDKSMTVEESAEQTPKVKRLLDDVEEHLKETPDGQAVVHSNLIQGGADVLSAGLKKRGLEYAVFIGKGNPGVTEESRQQAVQDFNDGKKKVLVISAAGGEGLDLRNATMFASLDGHFNPERIQQAEARAVRAGGQSHRDPDARRVIVKRYVNVVPRSVTQTAKNVLNLISPNAIFNRLTEKDTPLFYNPFVRERSPDEWMYGLAQRKNTLNEEFRQQLKKAASATVTEDEVGASLEKEAMDAETCRSFCSELAKIAAEKSQAQTIPFQAAKHIKSDAPIMKSYWNDFGDKIEKMDDPLVENFEGYDDQLSEQRYIAGLRKYYREAAKPDNAGTPPKGVTTDKDYWKHQAKITAIMGPILGHLAAPVKSQIVGYELGKGLVEEVRLVSPNSIIGRIHPKAAGVLGAALLPAALGTMVLAPLMAYTGRKDVHFATAKAKARKMGKLEDDELRALLRGLSVVKEETKRTEHYIKE